MDDDQKYLQMAFEVGNKNDTPYNFGAVVVKDGAVIAQENNQTRQLHDPSAHAEVMAMRSAGKALASHDLKMAALYTALTSHVLCVSAVQHGQISSELYTRFRLLMT